MMAQGAPSSTASKRSSRKLTIEKSVIQHKRSSHQRHIGCDNEYCELELSSGAEVLDPPPAGVESIKHCTNASNINEHACEDVSLILPLPVGPRALKRQQQPLAYV
ncbi:hypothetical protein PsorP6_014517 [Peronosclerospora sorghi]|uniref:Uncharacterized protein n=1 Tax=Peronosclerospora sorghi TaxID=230839 RepID=A0ACC0VT40_9STRA|nr:hypothetical protein PsorP6_014517 [Peronosclerospora sorghi]